MAREPLHEDLLDVLTRLVGRPLPVVQEALARLLDGVGHRLGQDRLLALGPFPLTAWRGLCAGTDAARQIWADIEGVGLSTEEVFTALAVIDDHVRRRYGTDAWARLNDWTPALAGRYKLRIPPVGRAQRDAARLRG